MCASAGAGTGTRPRLGWHCRGRTARRGRSSAAMAPAAWPDRVTEMQHRLGWSRAAGPNRRSSRVPGRMRPEA
ncbi:hypothetical protein PAHAL_5G267800 [Panicum hallii]|uniref:Uncharacterized protein n=1 Tax=Panicum hallii TaxID=206008 RepID=A0A2T8ILC0_9POAL|nr:hypothetical protein PAHAL_5G267800 [Panicum hallii]